VRIAIRDDPPPATHIPSDEGTILLRVPTPGRFDDLLACYQAQRRPSAGFFCSYDVVTPRQTEPARPFGTLVPFQLISGPPLSLTVAVRLASAVREAVMDLSDVQPAPEILSGHAPDNSPSQRSHLAYVPMAFVDHRFADGMIRGFAAVIPNDVESEERKVVVRALSRLRRIWLDPSREWTVERVNSEVETQSLKSRPYERLARSWATVTPMVFDQFPKKRPGRDAPSIIGRACGRIGLPEPIAVEVSHVSRIRGVPTSPEFNVAPKPGVPARPYAHVALLFDQPVRGPVLLGAGRYLGLGLFRAMDSPRGGRWRGAMP
jgi:CRISPR-associated protein Csb2